MRTTRVRSFPYAEHGGGAGLVAAALGGMFFLIVLALVLGFSAPARADEPADGLRIVVVPTNCLQFWSGPTATLPVPWDAVLSFSACIQDASTYRIDREADLEAFVEQLQADLSPSVNLYERAIQDGPGPIQLRAAYYIGLGQVALMTRARASVTTPRLRPRLEQLLEPHARLAYLFFVTLDRAAELDPRLTRDAVSRYMVASARELADSLRHTWMHPDEERPLLALPR